MTRRTWLDDLLERFQHRWETNPQYRAAMSGVLGLVFLLSICGCVGLVTKGASNVLSAVGIGASANNGPGQTNAGNDQKGVVTFPVTTVTPAQPGTIPYATLPTSGTPIPTATPSPTATDAPTSTPCVSNCGGGGGCNDCTVSDYGAPNPYVHGQQGSVVVHTSKPYIPINVIAQLPGCTLLNNAAGTTDASGNYTYTFTVCAGAGNTQIIVSGGFPSGEVYGPTIVQPVV
jgi:hypothetical protein